MTKPKVESRTLSLTILPIEDDDVLRIIHEPSTPDNFGVAFRWCIPSSNGEDSGKKEVRRAQVVVPLPGSDKMNLQTIRRKIRDYLQGIEPQM